MTLTPYAYQCEGVAELALHATRILGDDPGLGKSVQAIRACDSVFAKSVLVLCPGNVRTVWEREFETWGLIPRSVGRLDTGRHKIETDVVIVSYDLVASSAPIQAQLKRAWDVVILDEAHALKTPSAKRTKQVYGAKLNRAKCITADARHVWPLSGTLAPNDASELWTHVRALFPETLPPSIQTKDQWEDAFCKIEHGPFGRKVAGTKNHDQLKRFMARIMTRRRADDVLDLPPLTISDLPLDGADPAFLQKLVQMNELDGLTEDELLAELRLKRQMLATERRMVGVAKAELVGDFLRGEMAAPGQHLVFAWHREAIASLATKVSDFAPLVVDGSQSRSKQIDGIEAFKADPSHRVLIAQIACLREGETLTNANVVTFAEASWTPKDNVQAMKRAHRIGQTKPVRVRFASIPGSVDDLLSRALRRKTQDFLAVFG